jgi:hypothetical protein
VIGPGSALALAHGGNQHHKSHTRRHVHTERFGGSGVASDGATGVTGVTGSTGSTQPPAPQAGNTVASLTNGVLTIRLADGTMVSGTMVSGTITDATRIDCESMAGGQEDENGDGAGNDQHGGDGGGRDGSGGGPGDDGGPGNVACTLAAATPGTVVSEAELRLSGSGAVWESLLLIA